MFHPSSQSFDLGLGFRRRPNLPVSAFVPLFAVGVHTTVTLQSHSDFKSLVESFWFFVSDLPRDGFVSQRVEKGADSNGLTVRSSRSRKREGHQASNILNEVADALVIGLLAKTELSLMKRGLTLTTVTISKTLHQVRPRGYVVCSNLP